MWNILQVYTENSLFSIKMKISTALGALARSTEGTLVNRSNGPPSNRHCSAPGSDNNIPHTSYRKVLTNKSEMVIQVVRYVR